MRNGIGGFLLPILAPIVREAAAQEWMGALLEGASLSPRVKKPFLHRSPLVNSATYSKKQHCGGIGGKCFPSRRTCLVTVASMGE